MDTTILKQDIVDLWKDNDTRPVFRTCECMLNFYTRHSYYTHKKKCPVAFKFGKYICQEDGCYFKSLFSDDLIGHLRKEHHFECPEEIFTFNDYPEFENWKDEFEKRTKSFFVLRCKKKQPSGQKMYFYCNRSGSYSSISNGKRLRKSQGLAKIGFNCPARLLLTVEHSYITVNVHNFHYGHEKELAFLRIPKSDKKHIANQMTLGLHHSEVLRNIASSEESEIQRKHLCTKRDLLNIAKSFRIEKLSGDHLLIDTFVNDNLQNEKSIFIYKRPGEDVLNYPLNQDCRLENSDFVLGFMTVHQKTMFNEFGNDVVCVDATHILSKNEYNLTTIFVINGSKEVVPVAWLLSNKENREIMKLFFENIRRQIDNIHPKIFVSENMPQYYNVWEEVFNSYSVKLLSHWHVRREWKKNLSQIQNEDLVTWVFEKLCALLEETKKENFHIELDIFCTQLEENTDLLDFYKYFKSVWLVNMEEWMKSHQIVCGINTDIFSQYFSKMRNYAELFLRGKQNKICKCLLGLHKLAEKNAFKRNKIRMSGKNPLNSQGKLHQQALKLPLTLVRKTSRFSWEVFSDTSEVNDASVPQNMIFQVRKKPDCRKKCKIECKDCNICIHLFSCSCSNKSKVNNVCMHVHLVNIFENKTVTLKKKYIITKQAIKKEPSETLEIETNSVGDFTRVEHKMCQNYDFDGSNAINNTEEDTYKKVILEKLVALYEKVRDCTDSNVLLIAKQHIDSAISLMNISNGSFDSDKTHFDEDAHMQ